MDRINHKNGLTGGELRILSPFVKEPWRVFTLGDIKKISRQKSHHYVYDSLNKFAMKNITNIERRGNTNLYKLKTNEEAIGYISFLEYMIREQAKVPHKNLAKIAEKIKGSYYSMIITGSYAEGKQTKKSDIDIIIIIPNNESKKMYEIALKEGELMIPEIHGFVFTENEFYLMLTNKEFNLGKETARKHLIFSGAESYYKILFRALENGFTG